MDKLSMCRICRAEDVLMQCILNTNLQDIYEKITAMPFETKDNRPLQVCYICCARLRNCYHLQSSCLQSEEFFTQMLENNELKPMLLQHVSRIQIEHPVITLCIENTEMVVQDDNVNKTIVNIKVEPLDTDEIQLEEAIYKGVQDSVNNQEANIQCIEVNVNVNKDNCKEGDKISKASMAADSHCSGMSMFKKSKLAVLKESPQSSNSGEFGSVRSKLTAEKCNRESKVSDKVYKCDICDKTFTVKSSLKTHIRIHTGEKPFKCEICEKSFVQKSNLSIHIDSVHNGAKPYKCEVCEKYFGRKSHLKIHDLTHTGEKPFKCDICEKYFSRRGDLNTHNRSHTGAKPYKCMICEKFFSHNSHLNNHIRLHTGERRFKCDICDKYFNNKFNLNRHTRSHTGEKQKHSPYS